MFNKSLPQKGFSLIEVVVALSILMMVLASAVGLIITVVNLNLIARSKTEAVAFAQDGLAKGAAQVSNGCFLFTPGTVLYEKKDGRYFRTVTHERGDLTTNLEGNLEFSPNASGAFIRVVSKVQWYGRTTPPADIAAPTWSLDTAKTDYYDYEIKQIIGDCSE